MISILDGSLCYLIGAVDFAHDLGVSWRSDIIRLCKNSDLKIKFLDPTNKISGLQEEIGDERNKIVQLKSDEKWDELSLVMKTVVRQDHRCIDLSDFVVFYLDLDVHTCGSYFEFQSVLTQKKPYFLIIPQGKASTPSWLFGICDHTFIFDNMNDVVTELIAIDNGATPLSDKWVLFRKEIKDL